MRSIPRIFLVTLILAPSVAGPCAAAQLLSLDLGYIDTPTSSYGRGFVYGATLTEGTGRIGFGVALRRFSNSIRYDRAIKVGGGETVFEYEEAFADFYLTIMATYNHPAKERSQNRLLAGIGPQVHFVRATKYYITDRYSRGVNETRLGIGFLVRYHRRMEMFGGIAFILSAMHSRTESGTKFNPLTDYAPPPESVNPTTVTAGLAFPF
jgi:hypothetical protein